MNWFNNSFYIKVIKPMEVRFETNKNTNSFYNFDVINWFNP